MKAPSARAWIAIGGGVAAVLVAVPMLLLAAVQAGAADGLVRGALSAKLGHPISFARMRATLAPGASRVVFDDLVIRDPPRFGPGTLARIRILDVRLKLLPLLVGRLDAPQITVTDPVLELRRRGPGNNNYTFGKGGASSFLAHTQRLEITGGRLSMDDPQRHLTLQGAVSHDPADPNWPLRLSGGGVLNGASFTAQARGGPLNGRKPGAPHPVDVRLVDGDTRVRLVGSTHKPFDFGGFDIEFTGEGPNLADLVYLFNLLAPNSPAFTAKAHMRKDGKVLYATGIEARIGDSDLRGEITSDHSRPRRLIKAKLRSTRLTARDLQTMLASPPDHATARGKPGAPGESRRPRGRVLSSSPLSPTGLQRNDVTLRYAAETVTGFKVPISAVKLDFQLDAGRLRVAPLTFRAAGGTAKVSLDVDADRPTPRAALTTQLRGLQLGSLSGKRGFSGRLDADLNARGTGASIAAAAADADGSASLRVRGGALPKLQAEALQGDLFGLVGAALAGGKGREPLRCAAADFTIAGGVMRATRLEVGAGDGLATGGGTIDLRREQLNLALRATSAGAKPPVQLKTPITLSGSFQAPKVEAKLSKASLSFGGVFSAIAKPFRGDADKPTPAPGC